MKQRDLAYFRLRNMIISLELEPGAHVDELGLSKLLELGRTPIREALQQLSNDNLVIVTPRKGTTITPINTMGLKEVNELRWELDCLAARWAAERGNADKLDELEQFIQELTESDFADRHHHVEADRHFHLQIARIAGNRYLGGTIDQLFNHSVRLFNASGAQMATTTEELHDYRIILEALQANDPTAAENAMKVHLQDYANRVAQAYASSLTPGMRTAS